MPVQAVIFDLDGVVTDTARAHIHSWKDLFDEYLHLREEKYGEPFVPFDPGQDYLGYVDGKPRYRGVESFLKSRHIEIPYGDPADPPGKESICGLGNKKNLSFQKIIEKQGAQVYSNTLQWIERLKENGIKIGMATSSKNGPLILKVTGLTNLFQATVDGNDSAQLGLKGKPNPDIFLECAKRLGVDPRQSVVVEDAIAGVQAGRNGHFGVVIGMARTNPPEVLQTNGADTAVRDLMEISMSQLNAILERKGKA